MAAHVQLRTGAAANRFLSILLDAPEHGLDPLRARLRAVRVLATYPKDVYPQAEREARFARLLDMRSAAAAADILHAIDANIDPSVFADAAVVPWHRDIVEWYAAAGPECDAPRSVPVILGVPVTTCVCCGAQLLPVAAEPRALSVDRLAKTETSTFRLHAREGSYRCEVFTRRCANQQCRALHGVDHAEVDSALTGTPQAYAYRFDATDSGAPAEVTVLKVSDRVFVAVDIVNECEWRAPLRRPGKLTSLPPPPPLPSPPPARRLRPLRGRPLQHTARPAPGVARPQVRGPSRGHPRVQGLDACAPHARDRVLERACAPVPAGDLRPVGDLVFQGRVRRQEGTFRGAALASLSSTTSPRPRPSPAPPRPAPPRPSPALPRPAPPRPAPPH